jgi:hypothetical protein
MSLIAHLSLFTCRDDNHWIDNLVLRAGTLVESMTAPVYLSFNRQDFVTLPFNLTFYAPPIVSRVFPPGGDVNGGTLVTIHGSHLVDGEFIKCR